MPTAVPTYPVGQNRTLAAPAPTTNGATLGVLTLNNVPAGVLNIVVATGARFLRLEPTLTTGVQLFMGLNALGRGDPSGFSLDTVTPQATVQISIVGGTLTQLRITQEN